MSSIMTIIVKKNAMEEILLEDALQAIRDRHGLSWKEIYECLGISRQTLSEWRRNGALKWSDIVKLYKEFGIHYWEFFEKRDGKV